MSAGGEVEVVAGYFEAEDLAASLDALDEDVVFAFHGEIRHLAGADRVEGKEAAVAWLADWFSRFAHDYRFELVELRELDGRVLAVTRHDAKGRTSGVPLTKQTANLMTVRGGRIVRQDFFGSREEALAAAGATE